MPKLYVDIVTHRPALLHLLCRRTRTDQPRADQFSLYFFPIDIEYLVGIGFGLRAIPVDCLPFGSVDFGYT